MICVYSIPLIRYCVLKNITARLEWNSVILLEYLDHKSLNKNALLFIKNCLNLNLRLIGYKLLTRTYWARLRGKIEERNSVPELSKISSVPSPSLTPIYSIHTTQIKVIKILQELAESEPKAHPKYQRERRTNVS